MSEELLYPDEEREIELWQWLGLGNRHARNNVDVLMRAKAKAQLADLHPLSVPAVTLIDYWLDELVRKEKRRLTTERAGVEAAIKEYTQGSADLLDLISELKTIAGVEDDDC